MERTVSGKSREPERIPSSQRLAHPANALRICHLLQWEQAQKFFPLAVAFTPIKAAACHLLSREWLLAGRSVLLLSGFKF